MRSSAILTGLSQLFLLVGILGITLPAKAAASTTKTAQTGNVRAELSYQKEGGELPTGKFSHLRLKIIRAGQTLLDQPLPESEGSWPIVALEDSATDKPNQAFQVGNLDADPEPEVLLDVFTGGAHCCTYSLIYRYDAAKRQYTYIKHDWGNVSYRLKQLDKDKIPEFSSADDRFAYAFGSYAGSGYPIQIWRYQQGKLLDVTRQYPQLIYNDAYYWWQVYLKNRQDDTVEYGRGVLAPYLANKYLLGQGQDGWQRLQQVYRGSDRQDYFIKLRKFLQSTGYIPGGAKSDRSR